ncbi:hypothetical protein [Blastomonas sp.]|uniref:hypothetical protein n=1 Tax=Blastomonas sp. TaxID=1909299 RepID=UPI003594667E
MSLTLIAAMAMAMTQGDPVDATRKTYNDCLTSYTNESLEAKKPVSAFTKDAREACATQREAFAGAMVKSEMQYGGKKAEADTYAAEEVSMVVESFIANYGDYLSSNARMGAPK